MKTETITAVHDFELNARLETGSILVRREQNFPNPPIYIIETPENDEDRQILADRGTNIPVSFEAAKLAESQEPQPILGGRHAPDGYAFNASGEVVDAEGKRAFRHPDDIEDTSPDVIDNDADDEIHTNETHDPDVNQAPNPFPEENPHYEQPVQGAGQYPLETHDGP